MYTIHTHTHTNAFKTKMFTLLHENIHCFNFYNMVQCCLEQTNLAFLTLDIVWLVSFIIQNSWEACNQGTTEMYYSELSKRCGLDLNPESENGKNLTFKHPCVNSYVKYHFQYSYSLKKKKCKIEHNKQKHV